MLGGKAGQAQVSERTLLPPVTLYDVTCSLAAKKVSYSERRVPLCCGIALGEAGYGRRVKMVVMVVRKNYGIDGRQPVKVHRWWHPPPRSGELYR
jgi:hypothetical protein